MLLFSSGTHSLTAFSWIASLSLMPGQAHAGHRRGVVLYRVLHWSIQLGGSPAFLLHFHGQECSLQSLELLAALLRTCANFSFFKGLSHSQNCVVSHKKRKRHISSKDWLPFPVIFQVLFQAWSPKTSQWNRIKLFYFNEGQRAHFSLMSSSEGRYILWNLHMWMGPCLWGGFTWAKI